MAKTHQKKLYIYIYIHICTAPNRRRRTADQGVARKLLLASKHHNLYKEFSRTPWVYRNVPRYFSVNLTEPYFDLIQEFAPHDQKSSKNYKWLPPQIGEEEPPTKGSREEYYLYRRFKVSTSHVSLKHCAQHSANVDFPTKRRPERAPNHDFHDCEISARPWSLQNFFQK